MTTMLHHDLEATLHSACRRIAPVWPLDRFVAVNPYLGLSDLHHNEAATRLAAISDARTTVSAADARELIANGRITEQALHAALAAAGRITSDDAAERGRAVAELLAELERSGAGKSGDKLPPVPTVTALAGRHGVDWARLRTDRVSAFAAAYFDHGQALWRSADHHDPLFTAWRNEALIDRTPEVMGLRGMRRIIAQLPSNASEMAALALRELAVPAKMHEWYLHAVLLEVGGWAAYAARVDWDARLAAGPEGAAPTATLDLLGVLLAWEVALHRSLTTDTRSGRNLADEWASAMADLAVNDPAVATRRRIDPLLICQDAYERSEQQRLIDRFNTTPAVDAINLTDTATGAAAATAAPEAQTVFCIDVRSEVIRRHLETVSPKVHTLGFAGFFGMPVEYVPVAHEHGRAQCPALLLPAVTVHERTDDGGGAADQTDSATEHRRLRHQVRGAWKSFKMGAVTCFSFVGPVGLIYLPKLFTDDAGRTRPVPLPDTEGLPDTAAAQRHPEVAALPLETRINLAEGALRAMSLTSGFAPILALIGHGSASVNNAHAAGLDCGACGGQSGEANARIAAALLNDPEVRVGLAARGIHLDERTHVVAGLHTTTTDEITILDRDLVPASHREALATLETTFAEASRRTRVERAPRLPATDDRGQADEADLWRRAADWAQVRPEWGLAGCRTFVIAPRRHTAHLDLGGTSFLHSYDWQADTESSILRLLMTAPMVVTSWINLQYLASTVDNDRFGAGDKTLHNVVGKVGVLEGNGGDLRVGLPMQSVHDGTRRQHEPLRLNVVIEAPVDKINSIISSEPGVAELVDGDWVHLLRLDDDGRISHRYLGAGHWETVTH